MSGRERAMGRWRGGIGGGAATLLAAAAVLLAPALVPQAASAQEEAQEAAEERLDREVSQQEILRRLRESGISREEARRRLSEAGYDPGLLDPYFDRLRGEEGAAGEPDAGFASALRDIGLLEPRPDAARIDTLSRDPLRLDTLARDTSGRDTTALGPPDGRPPVFGRELFRRTTDQFQPVRTGPVDPGYRLGPGDQLVLVLTGDVQEAYTLRVNREGVVVIPDVGQLSVNGLTLAQLEDVLFQRLGEVYSGVTRGPNQSTFFSVSLGALRTNQVFLVGEVERPGSYQVSSVATVFNALYAAGGPTRRGSFRDIRVRRAGDVVREVDLYDYLLRGDATDDIRLEQGDIVFVPLAGPQVEVRGNVERPAIFELDEQETLADALAYAGGLRAEAFVRRVQIDRILPPEERTPGRSRKLVDAPLERVMAGDTAVAMRDGDVVEVFAVPEERRDRVTIRGAVWRPGTYELADGMTVWDLIGEAEGLRPEAVRARAQVVRLRMEDRRPVMRTLSLARGTDGEPVADFPLREYDEVRVFARDELREDESVSISGWVQEPGTYRLAEGMTLKDLVLRAGGLREGAYVARAEVSRLRGGQEWDRQIAEVVRVPIDSSYVFEAPPAAEGGEVRAPAGERVEGFELQAFDRVYVRRSPGFVVPRDVQVTGEVQFPGSYALTSRDDRLTDVVQRAGGLTPEAYAEGFQLWRPDEEEAEGDTATAAEVAAREEETGVGERTRVGVNFLAAIDDPDTRENVLVEPGDSIHVPGYSPTVEVRGAVGVPTKVLWREGAGIDYYIRQAGGYLENADEGRVRVRFANGEVATKTGGFLFLPGSVPDPDPGSRITVPAEPPQEREPALSTGQWITLVTSVLGSVATIVVATN